MGTRKHRDKQEGISVPYLEIATAPGHPFYERLGELLDAEQFDSFAVGLCAKFYSPRYGRPSAGSVIRFLSRIWIGIERYRACSAASCDNRRYSLQHYDVAINPWSSGGILK
jgi:hypothetical protein